MKHLILLIFSMSLLKLNAQISDCDCEGRYLNEIFSSVDVATVTYSETYNLEMDVYTPVGDVCQNRPLLVFAHGGAFVGGSKNNSLAESICESFAKRGYVAASINYRLATHNTVLGNDLFSLGGLTWFYDLENGIKVLYSAFSDAKAAIRYFRKDFAENGNTFSIDNNQIWFGGNSAGSALGPHLAYINSVEEFIQGVDVSGQNYVQEITTQNGGIEGNSGNQGYSSEISGLINLAGAIHNLDWIAPTDNVPIVSCHGTNDSTVPENCGSIISPGALTVCGSIAMEPVLEQNNIINDLLVFPGEGHSPWTTNSQIYFDVLDFIVPFVFNNLNCSSVDVIENNLQHKSKFKIDIFGRNFSENKSGLFFEFHLDGSVSKKYLIEN